MLKWLKDLDRILRGEATNLEALREGRIEVPVVGLSFVILVLGLITGSCVGSFAVFRPRGPFFMQLLASTVKVPALFLLTLVVTFPSLYVFNALVGSRLTLLSLLRLLVAALGVTLAMLAAFGPIVAFFSVSTTSYPFMTLLNVLVFSIGGMLGLKFLLQTLHRLSLVSSDQPVFLPDNPPGPGTVPKPAGALDKVEGYTLGKQVRVVFRCWVVVFALVGAQMSWVLRPFIGDPNREFEWFRARESNFFQSVWYTFLSLFS
ncbi:MAG: hypothetical protein HY290_29895 [Planctomycetia bacterium]|nr:hypothetical protein [Planctomycetia bacterium]